jgi:hypothetical protein
MELSSRCTAHGLKPWVTVVLHNATGAPRAVAAGRKQSLLDGGISELTPPAGRPACPERRSSSAAEITFGPATDSRPRNRTGTEIVVSAENATAPAE